MTIQLFGQRCRERFLLNIGHQQRLSGGCLNVGVVVLCLLRVQQVSAALF